MIPNLFKKNNIPNKIPKELNNKIKDFSKSKNKEEFLKKSFFYIVNDWGGSRVNLIYNFPRLRQKDLSEILKSQGYMHCTTMNYLLRVMAVKSNLFSDRDIKLKLTNTWYIIPHQYLEIKISNKKGFSSILGIINSE
jgi:CII-binding regulator of phage lambda lysogenization HflD